MAIFRRKRPKSVIVHSDRGSQYCSHAYRQLLQQNQLLGSMSANGKCYDNACAESFFHSLKVEAIHGEQFGARETMRQTVFEYIETDYLCPWVQSRQTALNQWLFKPNGI